MRPRERRTGPAWAFATIAALAAGCATDVPRLMRTDEKLQTRVLDAIASDSTLAHRMVDRLLLSGGASQILMLRVAQDRSRLDGVVNLAVQDSAMKDHLLTLVSGMQMVGQPR